LTLLGLGWPVGAVCAAMEPRPRSMLVLEQSDGMGPLYVSIFAGLRSVVNAGATGPIPLYVEHLDLSRFGCAAYEAGLERHFREKYADRPIGVIVALGAGALEYALRWRASLWPETPIVFGLADPATVETLNLPADVTGHTSRLALADMVAAAKIVVPGLRHLAIVGDRLETQPIFRPFLEELPAIAQAFDVIDLTGLPIAELRQRLAALPASTAILYTAIYSDGKGAFFAPAEALALFADAARAPIIASVETYIGRGATGGYVQKPETIGAEAARTALRILDGEPASSLPVSDGGPPRLVLDARQLARWGIDESRLPADSEIRYRAVPIWRQYPWQSAAASSVVVVQTGLIAALLQQYRRRRRAEIEARARLRELVRVNRFAVAGELSAAIAHQLNQPLGAVLANAETAALLLRAPAPDVGEIQEILGDVQRNSLRASDILSGLRRLLRKADADMQPVDLNRIAEDVLGLAWAMAADARVDLASDLPARPLLIRADAIQLQQAMLNLLVNAIEAVRDGPGARGSVLLRVGASDPAIAEVTIEDSGPGIPEDETRRIFEPLYSTKPQGMGMGLAIARTIVERHGGTLAAEPRSGGGSRFRIRLPRIRPDGAS